MTERGWLKKNAITRLHMKKLDFPSGGRQKGYEITEFNESNPSFHQLFNGGWYQQRHFNPVSVESLQRLTSKVKFNREKVLHITADGPEEFLEAIHQLQKFFDHVAVFSITGSNRIELEICKGVEREFNIDSHHIMYVPKEEIQWAITKIENLSDSPRQNLNDLIVGTFDVGLQGSAVKFILEDFMNNYDYAWDSKWHFNYHLDGLLRGSPLWYCWGRQNSIDEVDQELLKSIRTHL